jgi:hypothetical protein
MEQSNLLEILASVGSVATPILVLVLSAIGWMYRNSIENKLNQYFEIHKQKLKNSEFFFQKQFDASQALYLIKTEMLPPYNHPDMEWEEAVQQMANNLEKTRDSLQGFLNEFFTVLNPEILEKLESAVANADEGRLYGGGEDFREPGNQCAEHVYKKIKECSSLLKAEVDGQRQVEFHEFPKK